MQTRAGPPNLARHQRQGNQTAAVIRTMDMLRHAHTPENHARLCTGKATRHSAQSLRANATNALHFFGDEIFQMGFFRLPILGILGLTLRVFVRLKSGTATAGTAARCVAQIDPPKPALYGASRQFPAY